MKKRREEKRREEEADRRAIKRLMPLNESPVY